MTKIHYRIFNRVSGADLGVYAGVDADEAVLAMLADSRSADLSNHDLIAAREYVEITIGHVVERDGFGGDESEEDVAAYCEAVADRILVSYPGAKVTCETGLSRHTEIDGTDDVMFADEIRQTCREAASAVWDDGDFWT